MKKDFADFYDQISSQKGAKERANSVLKYVKKLGLKPKNILELGVGNGNVIKNMPKNSNIYGLDVNKRFLKLAKNKNPKMISVHSSMHNFNINEEFDLIYSVFDSINFLENFTQWKQTFKTVKKHLSKDGLFIFDMYTQKMLEQEKNNSPSYFEERFGYVLNKGEVNKNTLTWNFKIFEKQKSNDYKLWEELFEERIYSQERVEKELKKYFKILDKQVMDDDLRILYVLKNGK